VSVFKQLIEIPRRIAARLRDKRTAPRYPVHPDFPLSVSLRVLGTKTSGAGAAVDVALQNLCTNGAGIRWPGPVSLVRGDKAQLRLAAAGGLMEIPCQVAHVEAFADHARVGLFLQFTEIDTQRTFAGLLEAVAVGASLQPVPPVLEGLEARGRRIEQFQADNRARLTVWRDPATRAIDRFELDLGSRRLRGEAGGTRLEVQARKATARPARTVPSGPAHPAGAADHAAERRALGWIAANLPEAMPADLREFLRRFAA